MVGVPGRWHLKKGASSDVLQWTGGVLLSSNFGPPNNSHSCHLRWYSKTSAKSEEVVQSMFVFVVFVLDESRVYMHGHGSYS